MIQNLNILNKALTFLTRSLILSSLVIISFSCGGDDSGEVEPPPPPPPPVVEPTPATLVFPEENSECLESTNSTETESLVDFQWDAGLDTDSYVLTITDLETGKYETHPTSATNKEVWIKRGNPYSWFVKSKSSKTTKTATSPIWKFYNAGDGTVTYAPFPAELVSPLLSKIITTSTVTLDWSATDVDNDIENFDVFFGTTEDPSLFQSDVTDSVLNDVVVEDGKKYYWKIKTKDSSGNISISELFYFTVNF